MLLARWGEFCCVRHCRGRCQRLKGFALSGCGGCEAWREGICVVWVVRAMILHSYFVSVLSTFVINFFTYGRAPLVSNRVADEGSGRDGN